MKKQQTGMTLIELVIVIIVLGIIAAVAAPRFMDLSGSATTSSATYAGGAFVSVFTMAQGLDGRANPDHATVTGGLDAAYDATTAAATGTITVDPDGDGTADATIILYDAGACAGGNEIDMTGGAADVVSYSINAVCTTP